MLFFDAPLTHHRYLAEVKNLLYFKSRPLCIVGKPRATMNEIARHVNATCVINNVCFTNNTTLILTRHSLLILNVKPRLASIQISNFE